VQLRFHPVAQLFPLLEGAEYAALVQSIKTHGLLNPGTIHPDDANLVLDGRNRLRACSEAGVEMRFKTWDRKGSEVMRKAATIEVAPGIFLPAVPTQAKRQGGNVLCETRELAERALSQLDSIWFPNSRLIEVPDGVEIWWGDWPPEDRGDARAMGQYFGLSGAVIREFCSARNITAKGEPYHRLWFRSPQAGSRRKGSVTNTATRK
jgi:hypothetical protein